MIVNLRREFNMNKQDVSMQLYTTRHFQPYEPILKFLSDSGIVNIELFGLESMNTDEFKSMMDQVNITSKSTHVGFESLDDTSNIISRANKMNIKIIKFFIWLISNLSDYLKRMLDLSIFPN